MSATQLGAILAGNIERPARPRLRRFRHDATYISERDHCRPVTREMRARILFLAEALERRTKPAGRRNGCLGYIGLLILRTLLLTFANRGNGICCPSYTAIGAATGLCTASIAAGLARLEAAGILEIARRLVRQRITRTSPITGEVETIVTTTQASNLYRFAEPGPWADMLPVPAPRARPFPARRQLSLLARLWKAGTDSSRQGANPTDLNPIPTGSLEMTETRSFAK